MVRTLLVCALLLALAPAARTGDKPKAGEKPPKPFEDVIRMTVYPASSPKPALKYQLLPELREMNPGNPILGYLRCFSQQNHFFYSKGAIDQREKWREIPLKDLPVEEMRGYGGLALRGADYAARLDNPDWQVLLRAKEEGYRLVLAEVQQMRELVGALQVRFRGEVADRRFNDAIVTAKTMFALARHLGKHPTLIGYLVGVATAHVGIGPLDEMLQQPGCPNLFWALTDLPQPFIDLREGMHGERFMLARGFPFLDDKAPMTEVQLQKAVAQLREMLDLIAPPGTPPAKQLKKDGGVQAWLDRRLKNEAEVRAARQRLVEFGLAERLVKTFPALQVLLLDQKYTFEEMRDEAMKGLALPYWQAEPLLPDRTGKHAAENVLGWVAPAVTKVRVAQARLEQRFALLRHVEALRLYAAGHHGQLPKQLSDIKLPLPVDPVTGRPFRYTLEGATATLEGSPLPHYVVRYVITVAK
jgi:hypothetical protein